MNKTILIASLGEQPPVITSMVNMLETQEKIKPDEIIILHSSGFGKKIQDGLELIQYCLADNYEVTPIPLNFADPTTHQDCYSFLHTFYTILEKYERQQDHVYISLAGGRKNTSALMAVLCQLFPSIKRLYHLIDKSGVIYSVSQLYDMPDKERLEAMYPDSKNLALVSIPYKCYPNADQLRQEIAQGYGNPFHESILNPQIELPLQIYLSQAAIDDYPASPDTFDNYLRDMAKPEWLRKNRHPKFEDFETNCFCLKKGGVGSGSDKGRPFYYQEGNKLIVARLTLHESTYEKLLGMGSLYKENHPPVKSLSQFYGGDTILLVPLGESPMVATQTYTLLQTDNHEWESRQIATVALIYPKLNGDIANGAKLIKKAFDKSKIPCEDLPIEQLADVASAEDCLIYLTELCQTIEKLRDTYRGKEIVLSLSGGRKGMSALTLFAAQQANVKWVYHTLITDPELEEKVTHETKYDDLKTLSSKEQINRLFLTAYDKDKFTLFPIPVISFV